MYSNFSSKVQTYQNDLQAYNMNDEGLIYFKTLLKISKLILALMRLLFFKIL